MNLIKKETVMTLIASTDNFSVDLDDAWKWIGYKAKRNAKDVLIKNFVVGLDFLRNSTKSSTGGRPSEQILLTVDCFKSLAMMANTEQGREVRKYFIECEHQLKTLLEQQKQSPQSTTQTEQPKVIMPTKEEVDYIKSRPWEKAELEGIPVDFDDVATKSGFKRAFGASRGITKS